MWLKRSADANSGRQMRAGPDVLYVVLPCGHEVRQRASESNGLFAEIECCECTLVSRQVRSPNHEIALVQHLPRCSSGLVDLQDVGIAQQAQGVLIEQAEIVADDQRTARHSPEA